MSMSKQPRLEESPAGRARHDSQDQLNQLNLNANAPQSALAIPELSLLISQYLDRHSLAMCLRVCRQWQNVWHYQLWEVVERHTQRKIEEPDPPVSDGPSSSLIIKNANHIRKLVLRVHPDDVGFLGKQTVRLLHLTELTVEMVDRQTIGRIHWLLRSSLSIFITRHQASLKKLNLYVSQSENLMDAIQGCSHLESLLIDFSYLDKDYRWVQWFNSQASRLQSLSLVDWKPIFPVPQVFIFKTLNEVMAKILSKTPVASLKTLQLHAGYTSESSRHAQLLLIMKSPELNRLSWSGFWVIARLAEAFKKAKESGVGLFCQELESLSLQSTGFLYLQDFGTIMASLPALTDLDVGGCSDGFRASARISFYFSTLKLRRIKMDGCQWATPAEVHDLLCTMPSLEVVIADSICDMDIEEDPRPWVCTGLRELTVVFTLLSPTPNQDDILDRLCRLERLEKMILRHKSSFKDIDIQVQFNLKGGLDKLKTLRRLRIFEGPEAQSWKEPEARWALEHWVQLKELNITMDDRAKELLSPRLLVK